VQNIAECREKKALTNSLDPNKSTMSQKQLFLSGNSDHLSTSTTLQPGGMVSQQLLKTRFEPAISRFQSSLSTMPTFLPLTAFFLSFFLSFRFFASRARPVSQSVSQLDSLGRERDTDN
jgi:predicted PurR-regulated permease PerM